jgi:hypothetical protein
VKSTTLVLALAAGCGSVQSSLPDASGGPDTPGGDDDAAPAACGDGTRSPGEVCYGAPITIVANDIALDGHLADADGDGDRDLVYLIGDQFKIHIQDGGTFSASGLDGPTVTARFAVSADLGGTGAAELVAAGDGSPAAGGTISSFQRNAAGQYNVTGGIGVSATAVGLALAPIAGEALPNVVALYQNAVVIGRYDANLRLTSLTGASVLNARDLATGRIDEDALADVVVAGAQGVLLFRGTTNGLAGVTNTPQNSPTSAVAICDLDADDRNDLVYAIAGNAGQLGTMRSLGGGAFAAQVETNIGNLGSDLECSDLDGDGRGDVLATRVATGNNAVLVALAGADGTLGEATVLPLAITPDYLNANVDFNNDGIADIVATEVNTQTIVILPSNP